MFCAELFCVVSGHCTAGPRPGAVLTHSRLRSFRIPMISLQQCQDVENVSHMSWSALTRVTMVYIYLLWQPLTSCHNQLFTRPGVSPSEIPSSTDSRVEMFGMFWSLHHKVTTKFPSQQLQTGVCSVTIVTRSDPVTHLDAALPTNQSITHFLSKYLASCVSAQVRRDLGY